MKNFHLRVIYVNEGDVLFVPPKWWHSVQCVPNPEKEKLPDLDVSMSVNRWFPCFHDDFERVKEAVVFALVIQISRSCNNFFFSLQHWNRQRALYKIIMDLGGY